MSVRMTYFRNIIPKNSTGLIDNIAAWWCKAILFLIVIYNSNHYPTSLLKSVLVDVKLYLEPSLTHFFILQ